MTYVTPTVSRTDFSCPHCSALAHQTWYEVLAKHFPDDRPCPHIPQKEQLETLESNEEMPRDIKERVTKWVKQMLTGHPFFERYDEASYLRLSLNNLYISECYNCKKLSVWRGENLMYPPGRPGAEPNLDLEEDIRKDINEAREIIYASPRGAAALLRLALQKTCAQLGEKDTAIDKAIGNMVKKGLDAHLQRAFDIVRVLGNEAVHPGVLDLRDDVETALKLIDLINIIAQQMISNRKEIDKLYSGLPSGKLSGIEARDKVK